MAREYLGQSPVVPMSEEFDEDRIEMRQMGNSEVKKILRIHFRNRTGEVKAGLEKRKILRL